MTLLASVVLSSLPWPAMKANIEKIFRALEAKSPKEPVFKPSKRDDHKYNVGDTVLLKRFEDFFIRKIVSYRAGVFDLTNKPPGGLSYTIDKIVPSRIVPEIRLNCDLKVYESEIIMILDDNQ